MVSPTLLILAGGAGSRSGGPRVIDPVGPNDETIPEYSIYDARRAGFGRIVFVIRKEVEPAFKALTDERFGRHHIRIEHVCQELGKLARPDQVPSGRTKPWGTTHAILMAASAIHEPFAVINAGDFYGIESYRALVSHLNSGTSDYAVVGYTLRHTLSEFGSVARGVCHVNKEGYLDRIVELKSIEREGVHARNTDAAGGETKLTGDEIASMNMWGFTPKVFDQLREHFQRFLQESEGDLKAECLIPNTINDMLVARQARVKMLHGSDSWFGITYGEDYSRAIVKVRGLIEGGYYPKRLWV
jgi:NDP-sugar pyrophosphorylase family protein